MVIDKLAIRDSCWLDVNVYEYLNQKDVYLNYVEYSPDYWYSNTATNIKLEKHEAEAIVNFLTKHFELDKHE